MVRKHKKRVVRHSISKRKRTKKPGKKSEGSSTAKDLQKVRDEVSKIIVGQKEIVDVVILSRMCPRDGDGPLILVNYTVESNARRVLLPHVLVSMLPLVA